MPKSVMVETTDGPVAVTHDDVPWSHWHVTERNASVLGRGVPSGRTPLGIAWSRADLEVAVREGRQALQAGRTIETLRCANRGCGGPVPQEYIDDLVRATTVDPGPFHFDPKYDVNDMIARMKAKGVGVHVAERTIGDGTLIMAD